MFENVCVKRVNRACACLIQVPRFGEPHTLDNRLSRHKSNFQRTFITFKKHLSKEKTGQNPCLKSVIPQKHLVNKKRKT